MPFPRTISASKINDFNKCPTLFAKSYFGEPGPRTININLASGAAIADGLHAGRKAYGEGKSFDEIIHCAQLAAWHKFLDFYPGDPWERNVRGLPNVLTKVTSYFTDYFPLGSEVFELSVSELGAEAEFSAHAELDPALLNPDTNEPILYSVRYDARVKNNVLGYGILDDKSTGSITDYWLNQWQLSGQMQGYLFVDSVWNNPPAQFVIIRGIPMTRDDSPMIELPPIFINEVAQAAWLADTIETIEDMIAMYKGTRRTRKARDWQCGGCVMRGVCENESLL